MFLLQLSSSLFYFGSIRKFILSWQSSTNSWFLLWARVFELCLPRHLLGFRPIHYLMSLPLLASYFAFVLASSCCILLVTDIHNNELLAEADTYGPTLQLYVSPSRHRRTFLSAEYSSSVGPDLIIDCRFQSSPSLFDKYYPLIYLGASLWESLPP